MDEGLICRVLWQITIPIMPFLWKEIMYKCSLAYDEVDFRETVDAFVSGRASPTIFLPLTYM